MRSLLLFAFLFCAIGLTVPTFAYGGRGGGGGGGRGGGGNNSGQATTPLDISASTKARKDVVAATAEVVKATTALNAIVAKLRAALEQTPEWVAAQSAILMAQANLEMARAPALAALQQTPYFAAAMAAKGKAEAQRDALRADPTTNPADAATAAQGVLEATGLLRTMEANALAADPTFAAAQAKLADANAKVSDMLKAFDASCKLNADWQAANTVLDQKQQALTTARKALADALAKEAQAAQIIHDSRRHAGLIFNISTDAKLLTRGFPMQPLPYSSPLPPTYVSADASHLSTLAICHFVCGGLEICFSFFFVIYIVMGAMMLNSPNMFTPPPGSSTQPPPAAVGWILIIVGSVIVFCGWLCGILTIISGRKIAKRRGRLFSLIMAGVNCLWIPIGTILSIFTFVVLLRPSVKNIYAVPPGVQ